MLYRTYKRSRNVSIFICDFSSFQIWLIRENTRSTVADVPGKERIYDMILTMWLNGTFFLTKCWKISTQRWSVAVPFSSHDWIFYSVTYLSKYVNWSNKSVSDDSRSKWLLVAMYFAVVSINFHCGGWSSAHQAKIIIWSNCSFHFSIYFIHDSKKEMNKIF